MIRKEVETVIHSQSDFAPVAYLRVKDATLVPKEEHSPSELPIPPILEDRFAEVMDAITRTSSIVTSLEDSQNSGVTVGHPNLHLVRSRKIQDWVAVANVQKTSTELTLEEEVMECFQNLKGLAHFDFYNPS